MRKSLMMTAGLMLTACATTSKVETGSYPSFSVQADFETPIMASQGDSADDPAIYIGPDGGGFLVGTDKQSGLYVYGLDGSQIAYKPLTPLNNVDVRDGFNSAFGNVLVVGSDEDNHAIVGFVYAPETQSFTAGQSLHIDPKPYGICLGRINGQHQVGVTTRAGIYYQYDIREQGGKLSANLVRQFKDGGKTEGCAFDDRTAKLYIAEEEGGLYAYDARPDATDERVVIVRPGEKGMAADLEGVTIYEEGVDGGYLIVSSQGNNSYGVFSLPDYQYVNRFEITDGKVDRTTETDGIAVTSKPTALYPKGFFIAQDDKNDAAQNDDNKRQNFKIVDWRKIAAGL